MPRRGAENAASASAIRRPFCSIRAELPHPGLAADAFVLASFRTTVAADGFLEEDGEVWAPDGTLLAQSRQLATVLPLGDAPPPKR